jgi:hypothetical protein
MPMKFTKKKCRGAEGKQIDNDNSPEMVMLRICHLLGVSDGFVLSVVNAMARKSLVIITINH